MKFTKQAALVGALATAVVGFSALVHAEKDEKEEDEAPVAFTALPEPVQKAAITFFGSADKLEATKDDEDGAVEYEVGGMKDGAKAELKLTAAGDQLEVERGIAFDALPAAVRDRLKKKFPEATFGEAEAVEIRVYEIKVTTGKKTKEIAVTPAGEIKKERD